MFFTLVLCIENITKRFKTRVTDIEIILKSFSFCYMFYLFDVMFSYKY